MNVLAVDTASKSLSLAILNEEKVLAEILVNNGLTHSEFLMPCIDKLLHYAGLDINCIDLFAVTSGPGSFTGLRIGISTINTFSYALKKKCVGLSALDVLAERFHLQKGIICPILDARRGEVYTAIYKGNGKTVERISDYQAISLDDLLNQLPNHETIYFTGEGILTYREQFMNQLTKTIVLDSENNCHIGAGNLGKLALRHLDEATEKILPMYLRESEAVIRWRENNPGANIDGL